MSLNLAGWLPRRADLGRLRAAVESNHGEDSLARFLAPEHWEPLSRHLALQRANRGQVVISQGERDRTVFFMESGILRVHRGRHNAELQLAVLGPGSVIGEGAFFSQVERNATVVATQAATLWSLTPGSFDELASRHPRSALALSMALGGVLSVRMLNTARQVSVT